MSWSKNSLVIHLICLSLMVEVKIVFPMFIRHLSFVYKKNYLSIYFFPNNFNAFSYIKAINLLFFLLVAYIFSTFLVEDAVELSALL